MMAAAHGATQRMLADLTIGGIRSMQKRAESTAEISLQETTQQYQFEIEGSAAKEMAWATVPVTLDYEFYSAPGQRDSDLDRPQFYFGADIAPPIDEPAADHPEPAPVAVFATVTRWLLNEGNGAVIGANVAVGCLTDQDGVAFSGLVHLSFQGFTALVDVETDYPDV
jgi:hypothetical protein